MPIDSVLLAGSFSAGSMELSFERGFQAIGVRTHRWDAGEFSAQLGWLGRNRLAHRLSIGSLGLRQRAARSFNRCLEEAVLASGAQALLVFKGEWVMAETLAGLRHRGVIVSLYYPDNPFPPFPNYRPESLPAARETDLYLVWSRRLAEKLRTAGVRNPAFVPFAWDPEVFPYQGEREQGSWPGALFLGNWSEEREAFLEEFASQVRLRIYGSPYWGSRSRAGSRVRSCWQGREVVSAEAAEVIRESAVCLNVLRVQHVIDGVPDGMIMRHFEVPGAGGFLLSTRSGGATELFPEGESAEYFSDVGECVEKSRRYIERVELRRQIAERGHALTASAHRYTDRARQVLELLERCR